MRLALFGLVMLCPILTLTLLGGSAEADRPPVAQADGVFGYRFDLADLGFADVLTLQSGAKRAGKVMEWANQVLLFEADGRAAAFEVADVDRFEFRRAARHRLPPESPDLTVAYVERLPRDLHWHGLVRLEDGLERLDPTGADPASRPAAGTNVTFRVHIRNAGRALSVQAPCRILIDGTEIKAATVPALPVDQEHIVEAGWAWQDGRHLLQVEIDPKGTDPEIVRWNNTFVEPTDALGVAVVVARDRYDEWRRHRNLVDSFSFEDWLQYQIRCLNGLFAASMHPSSPQGIIERVRCDRLLVVDNPLDAERQADWWAELHRDGGGPAEYAALWLMGPLQPTEVPACDVLKVDWAGLQGVARQFGLVDWSVTDTTVDQCYVEDQYRRYAERRHLSPHRRTMMHAPGGFPFDEPAAAYLNESRGRPRGFRGEYLYRLPENIIVEVRANSGQPLADVQVDVFQLMAEGEFAGTIAGHSRQDPLYSTSTGADGRVALLDQETPPHQTPGGYELRPNPFGKIAIDGSNGLLLLRLRKGNNEEFHFLRLYDCLVAALRGQTTECVVRLPTRFATPGSPPAPAYAAVKMDDRTIPWPALYLRWPFPADTPAGDIDEFRLYRRTGFAGDDARPWTLVSIIERRDGRLALQADAAYFEDLHRDLPYSLDTFHAVTAVDRQGRESALSTSGFVATNSNSIKLAMDTEAAYMTVTADGSCRMLRWDGIAGTQPFGLRTRRIPGYSPTMAGLAFGRDGRLIVTDPANHVLAFYDRGDLVELVPARPWWPGFSSDKPGEFYAPLDVASDDAGNLYVADFGNQRVQILDSRGGFRGLLDEGFRFEGPQALGFANGKLCVTDRDGTRCRVYEITAEGGRFLLELPRLNDADRGLVSRSGRICITGYDPAQGTRGVLVYRPEGQTAVYETVATEGIMGKFYRPRGMYLYLAGAEEFAYFVNEFPFDVGRYKME